MAIPKFNANEVPNSPGTSKILWASLIAVVVNLLIMLGVIPETLGPQTQELFNTLVFALIAYFRAFKTVSPNTLSYLRALLSGSR